MTDVAEDVDETTGWARLGDEVLLRRERLMLSHTGVAKQGGPSHETVRLIEQRGRPSFRDMSLAQLDNALDWKPGTAKRIVNGTAPADRANWEAEHTAEERAERSTALRRTRNATPPTDLSERQVVCERITIGLIPKTVDDLTALMATTGLSKTDLLNRGVGLLAFVQAQLDEGKDILVRNRESGEVEKVHLL